MTSSKAPSYLLYFPNYKYMGNVWELKGKYLRCKQSDLVRLNSYTPIYLVFITGLNNLEEVVSLLCVDLDFKLNFNGQVTRIYQNVSTQLNVLPRLSFT